MLKAIKGMTKVLVTGGSGFLGKNLKKANPEWVYISSSDCNLLSRQEIKQTLSFYKPESVLHLAGIVGGIKENSLKQGEFFYKNVCMNTNILEAARQMKIQRVLSCLSTCAFPDVVDEYPFSEESIFDGPPAKTNFSYGYAKRMLHVQSQAYRKQYGLNYSTFCPSNLYGPEDCYDENKSHFVPALIRKIHDEYVFEKHTPPEWQKQLINLNSRISLLKYTIMFAAFGFLFNMSTVLMLYLDSVQIARIIFAACCVCMIISIFLFLQEIRLSNQALKFHLSDMVSMRKDL